MTKAELIEKLARSRDLPPDMTKKAIGQVLDLAFAELSAYFEKSKVTRSTTPRFSFPGFGTFTKKKRSARKGVNPRTLEPIEIEACYTIDFKPAAGLKRGMNEGATASSGRAGSKKRATKRASASASKTKTARTKAGKKSSAKRGASPSLSPRRRLLTREEAELEAADADARVDELGGNELAEAPLRRVRNARRGGAKGRTG